MHGRIKHLGIGVGGAGAVVIGALVVALLGLGAIGVRGGFAQESTPDAETTTETAETTENADASAVYDEFVAGLAANLGIVDTATVDAAVQATLTDMVAAKLAAGETSANEAAALTERIAAGEVRLGLGWLDGHRRGGPGGPGGHSGDERGARMLGDEAKDDAADDLDSVGGGDTDESGTTEELQPRGTPAAVNPI